MPTNKIHSSEKSELHPRNKNNTRYDFGLLTSRYPELKQYIFTNIHKRKTIDFANPDAVRTLNKVLLKHFYGLSYWDIPKNYLCPPIPGRADYIHYVADLLASYNDIIPRGNKIKVFDIGVGSNCIYPIIGNKEYEWNFIGSDIDDIALASADKIVKLNDFYDREIQFRKQTNPKQIFNGIIRENEYFDLSICNPPFHSSMEQVESGTKRKWKNLGVEQKAKLVLNFGGESNELLYPGGEIAFTKTMILESSKLTKNILWFTTLVSRATYLSIFTKELSKHNAAEIRTIPMAQGQKKSRILAWTFHSTNEQKDWISKRW